MDRVLYIRCPGLLQAAAYRRLKAKGDLASGPLVVADGNVVRSASPCARERGIYEGQSVRQARRLCSLLLVVPLDGLDTQPHSYALWNALANLSPVVEPAGPDSGYADLSGGPTPDLCAFTSHWPDAVIGLGASRIAARALAECRLPSSRLPEADSRWLWPEDGAITARLFRLSLNTFGQVVSVGEDALHYQFGKTGRLLYRRAIGENLDPIRSLWPPPRARVRRDYTLEPIDNEEVLKEELACIAAALSRKLRDRARYSRVLRLALRTERGDREVEWVLPYPVQEESDIVPYLRRLLKQVRIPAPVTALAVTALDLYLPAAASGSLFDNRAAERQKAIAATKHKLQSRYGIKSLQPLSAIPVSRRDTRRELWKAGEQG